MSKSQELNKLALFFNLACQDGNFDSLKDIYSKLEQSEKSSLEAYFPLHSAVKTKSLPIVQFLVEQGFQINLQNNSGQTPLFVAAFHGAHEIVKSLIKMGADVNIVDNRGWTPLMIAVKNNDDVIAKLLVEEGKADLHIKDKYGKTAFDKVSSVKVLDALRAFHEEEMMLKSYSKPQEVVKEEEPRSNEIFLLRDLVNQGIDSMTKEDFEIISGKLKEKFLTHSRNLGLNVTEKAFGKIIADLDKRLEAYSPVLLEETNKNFSQKYKKFVREIEKYMNLRLNIALAATGQRELSKSLNQNPLDASCSNLENSKHLSESSSFYCSKDELKSNFQTPNSNLVEDSVNFEAFVKSCNSKRFESPSDLPLPQAEDVRDKRNMDLSERRRAHKIHLCQKNTNEWETNYSRSKSPEVKRFKSEGPSPLIAKKNETQKLYQIMIKQTDKMSKVISERAEQALDKIFNERIVALKANIDREMQNRFKTMVSEIKDLIELKINTAIKEKVKQPKPTTPKEALEKKLEAKIIKNEEVQQLNTEKDTLKKGNKTGTGQSKPLSELQNQELIGLKTPTAIEVSSQGTSQIQNVENVLDKSFQRKKEEFIRKKMEKRLHSPLACKEPTPKKDQITQTQNAPVLKQKESALSTTNSRRSGLNSDTLDLDLASRTNDSEINQSSSRKNNVKSSSPRGLQLLKKISQTKPNDDKIDTIPSSVSLKSQTTKYSELEQNSERQLIKETSILKVTSAEKKKKHIESIAKVYQPSNSGKPYEQTGKGINSPEAKLEIQVQSMRTLSSKIETIPSERTSECRSEENNKSVSTIKKDMKDQNSKYEESDMAQNSEVSFKQQDSHEYSYQSSCEPDSLDISRTGGNVQREQGTNGEKEYQLSFIRGVLEKASFFNTDSNLMWKKSRKNSETGNQ